MFVLKGTSVALRCNYGPLNARNMRLRLGIFFFFWRGLGSISHCHPHSLGQTTSCFQIHPLGSRAGFSLWFANSDASSILWVTDGCLIKVSTESSTALLYEQILKTANRQIPSRWKNGGKKSNGRHECWDKEGYAGLRQQANMMTFLKIKGEKRDLKKKQTWLRWC